jgi:hypothetical protein
LPHELTDADRAALTQDMSGWLMERYGVAVDAAIHAPVLDNGDDERNHHAHILFTTRQVTSDGLGKKTRILDGKGSGEAETRVISEVWESFLNDALVKAGYTDALVDRRSLEDQIVNLEALMEKLDISNVKLRLRNMAERIERVSIEKCSAWKAIWISSRRNRMNIKTTNYSSKS